MAHYAFLDDSNIVTEVIVGIDETESIEGKSPEDWYGELRGQRCLRTSYSSSIRFNYAGVGHLYDETNDAFIAPMPDCGHDELELNKVNFRWECTNAEHDLS